MDIEQDFHSHNNNNDNLVLTDAEQQQQQQHLTNNNNESTLLRGWNNSSRIFRVSRASGGKDRHSKVLTSKGLRDRRVRLSVSTAIQFYDLQDRLGYDQPSKAVEWLIKAAADSIAELPSLNGPFPDCTGIVEQNQTQNQNLSASSTSETSKGSGLSLTQSDVRVNQRVVARDRARERAKEKESSEQQQVVNDGQRIRSPISTSSTATFTELLTGGQSGSSPNNNSSVPVMDYFMANAARGRSNANANAHAAACLFLGQSHNMPPAFHLTNGNHHQHNQEQFSFGQQNLIESGNEHQYDLNFTISATSSPSGFNNRGTLQSNSHSTMHHNHLQRYSMEGSNNVPAAAAFFMATSAAAAAANNLESNTNQHHHFSTGLDGGLHLYYGDHKNKGGKN